MLHANNYFVGCNLNEVHCKWSEKSKFNPFKFQQRYGTTR